MHPRTVPTLALPFALALSTPHAAAGGEEWLRLDRELESFASAAQVPSPPSVTVGVLLRTRYAWVEESPTMPGESESGFALDDVRPWIEGRVGATTVRLALEGASGTFEVLDAWARLPVIEDVELGVGRLQPAVLRSALVDPQNLLFLQRTVPGDFWYARDSGVELAARLDTVLVRAGLFNGSDGAGDEPALSLRADWDAVATVPPVEGAYGSGRQTALVVGASYYDDGGALEDGDVISLDALLTTDRFSLGGEFQSYADDGGVDPGNGVKDGIFGNLSDTSPWSLSASFMVDPDRYELGLRYEDLDDDFDGKAITVGLNAYLAGRDLMGQINYTQLDSDFAGRDGGVFAIGLTVNL
jgi:hypothetical protein